MSTVADILGRLEARRRELGISHADLAMRSRVSTPTLKRMLSGRVKHSPSLEAVLCVSSRWAWIWRPGRWFPAAALRRRQAEEKGPKNGRLAAGHLRFGGARSRCCHFAASDPFSCASVALRSFPSIVVRMKKNWPAIPGETPLGDLSGLRLQVRVRTRADLDRAEAENILDATLRYLAAPPSVKQAPYTADWALRLHRQMFGRVWSWAGKLRTVELNLGVPAWQVEPALYDLMLDVHAWKGMAPREQAARLHHRAVSIHPFLNGNGRWSRMLADIRLRQLGEQPISWPAKIGTVSPVRQQYLAALRAADKGDLGVMLELQEAAGAAFWRRGQIVNQGASTTPKTSLLRRLLRASIFLLFLPSLFGRNGGCTPLSHPPLAPA